MSALCTASGPGQARALLWFLAQVRAALFMSRFLRSSSFQAGEEASGVSSARQSAPGAGLVADITTAAAPGPAHVVGTVAGG